MLKAKGQEYLGSSFFTYAQGLTSLATPRFKIPGNATLWSDWEQRFMIYELSEVRGEPQDTFETLKKHFVIWLVIPWKHWTLTETYTSIMIWHTLQFHKAHLHELWPVKNSSKYCEHWYFKGGSWIVIASYIWEINY